MIRNECSRSNYTILTDGVVNVDTTKLLLLQGMHCLTISWLEEKIIIIIIFDSLRSVTNWEKELFVNCLFFIILFDLFPQLKKYLFLSENVLSLFHCLWLAKKIAPDLFFLMFFLCPIKLSIFFLSLHEWTRIRYRNQFCHGFDTISI